jgi:F-type H+-transporting ATPase subunit b
MRMLSLSVAILMSNAAPLLAQEAEQGGGSLMSIRLNLMVWTLVIFLLLYGILRWKAFPAILGAVEQREKALQEAIDGAKRDREEAQRLLESHRQQIEAARGDAQRIIADGRAVAEKMRNDMIEQTHQEQQNMLERARREIENEKERAIAQLRREAVNLAIAGASKVIEQNLDSTKNRQLVEGFLSSLPALTSSNR